MPGTKCEDYIVVGANQLVPTTPPAAATRTRTDLWGPLLLSKSFFPDFLDFLGEKTRGRKAATKIDERLYTLQSGLRRGGMTPALVPRMPVMAEDVDKSEAVDATVLPSTAFKKRSD